MADQKVPKPDGYEGSNDDAWVLSMQDGRLGYPGDTEKVTTIQQLHDIRNAQPIKKH